MELLVVFAAALAFYCATLAPTVVWGDSAWLTLFVLLKTTGFRTAGDHPLFLEIGRVFSALPGDPARNLGLEAAGFGALAVMLVYRCARQLGASRAAAAAGAAALCVSHAFWFHAVIAEVYTANAFFLLATITMLIDWRQRQHGWMLLVAGAAFLLGLTNHLVLAGFAPAALVFLVLVRRDAVLSKRVFVAAASVCAVLSGVIALRWNSIAPTLYQLWVGPPALSDYFRLNVPLAEMAREAGYYALLFAYQFPSVSLPFVVLGVWSAIKRDHVVSLLLLVAVGVNAGVFIHHTAWDIAGSTKFVFYIADYAIGSVFCALGVDEFLRRTAASDSRQQQLWSATVLFLIAVVPPMVYGAVPAAANRFGLDLVRTGSLPYRDSQTYFLNPNKRGYDGARRFGLEALNSVPPGSVIYADYTPFAVLRYLQLAEHIRPDVLLKYADPGSDRVEVKWLWQDGARRPTYVAALIPDYYDFSHLEEGYDLRAAWPIIEVRPDDAQ